MDLSAGRVVRPARIIAGDTLDTTGETLAAPRLSVTGRYLAYRFITRDYEAVRVLDLQTGESRDLYPRTNTQRTTVVGCSPQGWTRDGRVVASCQVPGEQTSWPADQGAAMLRLWIFDPREESVFPVLTPVKGFEQTGVYSPDSYVVTG